MGLVIMLGGLVAVVGLALDSAAAVTVGVTVAILSVVGFVVPAFRDVRTAQPVDRESYAGFIANLLRTTPSASESHGRGEKLPPRESEEASELDRPAEPLA